MPSESTGKLPGSRPRNDKGRDMEDAVIQDAPETGDEDRDLVHGDGGTINIPTKPADISRDD